jgi:hypothetical protein
MTIDTDKGVTIELGYRDFMIAKLEKTLDEKYEAEVSDVLKKYHGNNEEQQGDD